MNFKQILCAGAVTVLFASGINSSTVHAFDNIDSAQAVVEENKPNVTSEIEDSEIVNIVDPGLLMCVNRILRESFGLIRGSYDPVTRTQAESMDQLFCHSLGISNLAGVEYFTNLILFSMDFNNIADISVFEKNRFPKLHTILLLQNNIEKVFKFEENNLPALAVLSLENNHITDLSPLKNFPTVNLFAMNQRIVLDDAEFATMHTKYIIGVNGSFIPLNFASANPDIVRSVGDNSWVFNKPGTVNIPWDMDIPNNVFFSGIITQTGLSRT